MMRVLIQPHFSPRTVGCCTDVRGIGFVGCTGGEGSKPLLWNLQNLCPVLVPP